MLTPLTVAILVADAVLALLAAYHLLRDRLINDRLLLVAAVVELGLLVQLVVGLVRLAGTDRGVEGAVFVAYLVAVLVVAPAAVFMAIKEKSRWAMGVLIVGAFVIGILVGRLEQIWTTGV